MPSAYTLLRISPIFLNILLIIWTIIADIILDGKYSS